MLQVLNVLSNRDVHLQLWYLQALSCKPEGKMEAKGASLKELILQAVWFARIHFVYFFILFYFILFYFILFYFIFANQDVFSLASFFLPLSSPLSSLQP